MGVLVSTTHRIGLHVRSLLALTGNLYPYKGAFVQRTTRALPTVCRFNNNTQVRLPRRNVHALVGANW